MKDKGKFGLIISTACILLVLTTLPMLAGCEEPVAPPAPPPAPDGEMGDLIALHEDLTEVKSDRCVSCHGNKAEETSLDPDIKTPHAIHIPMLKECNVCHKKADLLEGSAAALRKQVDPQVCNSCHGPGGPGPQLYQVEPTLSD